MAMKKSLFILLMIIPVHVIVVAQTKAVVYGNNSTAGHYAPVNGIQIYYETYGSGAFDNVAWEWRID